MIDMPLEDLKCPVFWSYAEREHNSVPPLAQTRTPTSFVKTGIYINQWITERNLLFKQDKFDEKYDTVGSNQAVRKAYAVRLKCVSGLSAYSLHYIMSLKYLGLSTMS